MRNIVIIGASSGIGRALAQQLTQEGDHVYGTYNKGSIQGPEGLTGYSHLDVLNEEADFSFLPDTIDGLAYCPDAVTLKPFHRLRPEDFMADYKLQVLGAIRSIQASLPKMKNSPTPSIVMFSTVAVQTGFNFHSMVSASKGAIEGLTRALAAELAPKIRVNCIAPSVTDTPLAASLLNTPEKREASAQRHPLKRIGQAEDVASLAAFLLSARSGWLTGQVIHADGGISSLRAS
ncbi:MAG: SDR family oxidoreductase [Bacteroidetes bacterium]|nr:SDR family oxidoreductase [Bacteroidota bacterium]